MKAQTLRIGCWNVTSWNNKDQEILIELNRHNIDLCALAETKRKGKGTVNYANYVLVYSGRDKHERAQAGVGLLIHTKYAKHLDNVRYISDKLLLVTLKLQRTVLHVISVYAPDMNKPREERELFYEHLQQALDTIPRGDKLLILGDFNARIGNDFIPGIKQQYNENVRNENGTLMIDFCAQNELRINNTFFPHKPQQKVTWSNSRGQESTIDYIVSNNAIPLQQILDVRTLGSANTGTDHHLLLCKFRDRFGRCTNLLHNTSPNSTWNRSQPRVLSFFITDD